MNIEQQTHTVRIGNRAILTHKQRFSRNARLRIEHGGRIEMTRYHDAQPRWIVQLYDELGIRYIKREPPYVRMQAELKRKANAIERSCRKHRERRQAESGRPRRNNR